MPQLSLYIDEDTLKRITLAAKIEKLSVSKFVVRKLNESMNDSWPSNFENLFGAISDPSFTEVAELNYANDATREKL